MSKLGYTFYPKDWASDEKVFELLLHERGLYRELIDLAMLNDNKTVINAPVWCRKYAINDSELTTILKTLSSKGLIQISFEGTGELFIPSCEKRLILVRAGSKGGKKSKPTPKPLGKPIVKPNGKQIEKKGNRKEIEIEIELNNGYHIIEDYMNNEKLVSAIKKNHKLSDEKFIKYFDDFKCNYLGHKLSDEKFLEAQKHFNNWIKFELVKEKTQNKSQSQVERVINLNEEAKELAKNYKFDDE